MSAHNTPTINTNNILKYIFFIILFALIYEFVPMKVDKNSDNKFLPENISTENAAQERLILKDSKNVLADYRVIKVVDGDTVDIQKICAQSDISSSNYCDQSIQKVRLIGINTPETVDPRKSVECFGLEASNYMKEIAAGQDVYIELDSTQSERDKYNRLLGYVYLADGQMLNRKMIAEGYAYEYTYNTPYKYQKDFKDVQAYAKNNNRGLWASNTCNGVK